MKRSKMIKIIKHFFKKNTGETSGHLIKTFFVYGFIALTIIIVKILIARLYGQKELGIFTFFFSLVSLIFLFTSFGLPEALTQTIIKVPEKLYSSLKKVIYLIIPSTIAFIIFTLIIITYTPLNPGIKYFNLAFVIYIVTYTFHYITYSILRGYKRFVSASFYSLINRIFWIFFIVILFFLSSPFVFFLFSMALALIIAGIIALPQIKKLITKEQTKINFKKFFYLSFSLFLMQVGFYSLRFLSEIIIAYLVDFNTLGLYSAYSSITNIIRLVAYVFPVVVLPMAVVNRYKLKHSLKKILTLLLPFSALVLALTYFFVPLFYGNEYQHLWLPPFLILSSTLLVVYSYLNSVFMGENKFSRQYLYIISLDFILSLVINSFLNIYLILKMGIIGAPIATSITIIFKIILNYYGIKRLRFRNKNVRTTDNN